jgi:hypothetical protein
LLREDFISVKGMIQEKLEGAQNLTVNLDGWTDISKHSVYTCNTVFPDRTIAQWDCRDLSADSHTADFLTGLLLLAGYVYTHFVVHTCGCQPCSQRRD